MYKNYRNVLKLCLLACHMSYVDVYVVTWDCTILKGVIDFFFTHNISLKSLNAQLFLHFKSEFRKLAYYYIEICISLGQSDLSIFEEIPVFPFWLRIFHQKVCTSKSFSILKTCTFSLGYSVVCSSSMLFLKHIFSHFK